MKKLPHILNVVAVVLIVLAVLYKVLGILAVPGGFGTHYAGPLGVAPSGILDLVAILLLLSLAINLQKLVAGKSARSAEAPEETTES